MACWTAFTAAHVTGRHPLRTGRPPALAQPAPEPPPAPGTPNALGAISRRTRSVPPPKPRPGKGADGRQRFRAPRTRGPTASPRPPEAKVSNSAFGRILPGLRTNPKEGRESQKSAHQPMGEFSDPLARRA